jgi:hypothetical protein
MAFDQKSILEYIKAAGPSVPNKIRQDLKAPDNFIVGALLSELAASGQLAMTTMSYGTSKFYYDPENPASIEPLGQHLGEKDQRAFILIKNERVARHNALTPLNRVAMEQIKDFAKPLKLDTPEGPELFWRYYLVTEDEAMDLIEEKFFHTYKKKAAQPLTPIQNVPASLKESEKEAAKQEPKAEPERKAAPKKKAARKKAAVSTVPEAQTQLPSRLPPLSVAQASGFATAIHEFFKAKQIVLVQNIASTKTEFSAIVRIPSAVGAVEYFCKAKSKKTTTDGDLAAAVLESQQYKLPLLFLSPGKLTKKANDLLPGLKGAVVATLGEESEE